MTTAAKIADICWGQRYFWLHRHWIPSDARHDEHIVLRHDLPEGVGTGRLRMVLNQLVRRHEALRTTFRIGPDGGPRQVVHPPAPVAVTVVDAGPHAPEPPAEVIRQHTEADFDLTVEPPLRAVVVTVGDVPRQLVLVFAHIAMDDWSVATLYGELTAMLAATGRPAALAPVRDQPADLAAREAVLDGPRRETDLGYWRTQVAALPADVYAHRRRTGVTESHSAALTSPDLLGAVRQAAARHQVWPSVVHLSTYAVLMAAYTGVHRVPYWLFTSRRETSADAAVLTSMFAPMLMNVDLSGDPPLSAVIRQVAELLDRGKQHLTTPYDELVELMALEGARRGQAVRVEAEVNFLSYTPRSCDARRSRFTWNRAPRAWARSGADSYFRIYEWQDGVTVALRSSGEVLDRAATERFLRAYQEIVTAHAGPDTDLTVGEIARHLDFGTVARHLDLGTVAGSRVRPTGRHDEPAAGPAAGEADLVTAVAAMNGLAEVDPLRSYVVAGGRAMRAPAVLAALAERGWRGLRVPDLFDTRPLRAIAGQLTPAGPDRPADWS
ncbi:condensation domain-containing protein [Micromonospora sp. WMMD1102]|uniref:condensation domain-containing protein n=1 Tax=Micromonospora sp. WMMD1102 TaxID=3016105 RepID=UPI0024156E78|nr:condensation domain-containing protein [Micromonospora sp. WMMD1102]MDG4785109.1 condensation domain-containing protein [Micromonospora sp. WMMD1102]